MAKTIAVSIIVPVYNVEKYLKKCLKSILQQTLKDIEVIIIDDGSTDKSPQIIDEFANLDNRIVAIHQKNSGYSATVNKGIRLSRGQYIGIVESDDYIEPTMYKKLYQRGIKDNADIVKGGFFKYNSLAPKEQQNVYYFCPSGIDLRNAPQTPFSATQWPTIIAFHSSVWSSIYKSKLIKKNKFPESAGASYQDFPFMLSIMSKANKISVVSDGLYHWRNDTNQVHSTNAKGEKALRMVENSKLGINIIKKSNQYQTLKEALYIHVLWTNIPFLFNIEKKYKKVYFEKLYKLLSPVKKDKKFQYQYFRAQDKLLFYLIASGKYTLAKAGLILIQIKRNIKNILQFKRPVN